MQLEKREPSPTPIQLDFVTAPEIAAAYADLVQEVYRETVGLDLGALGLARDLARIGPDEALVVARRDGQLLGGAKLWLCDSGVDGLPLCHTGVPFRSLLPPSLEGWRLAEAGRLAVAPSARGQGVLKALIRAILIESRARGAGHFLCQTPPANVEAYLRTAASLGLAPQRHDGLEAQTPAYRHLGLVLLSVDLRPLWGPRPN